MLQLLHQYLCNLCHLERLWSSRVMSKVSSNNNFSNSEMSQNKLAQMLLWRCFMFEHLQTTPQFNGGKKSHSCLWGVEKSSNTPYEIPIVKSSCSEHKLGTNSKNRWCFLGKEWTLSMSHLTPHHWNMITTEARRQRGLRATAPNMGQEKLQG